MLLRGGTVAVERGTARQFGSDRLTASLAVPIASSPRSAPIRRPGHTRPAAVWVRRSCRWRAALAGPVRPARKQAETAATSPKLSSIPSKPSLI